MSRYDLTFFFQQYSACMRVWLGSEVHNNTLLQIQEKVEKRSSIPEYRALLMDSRVREYEGGVEFDSHHPSWKSLGGTLARLPKLTSSIVRYSCNVSYLFDHAMSSVQSNWSKMLKKLKRISLESLMGGPVYFQAPEACAVLFHLLTVHLAREL